MRGHQKQMRVIKGDKQGNVEMVDTLQEAVDYLEGEGITLFGINENPTQDEWTNSRKVYGNIYIDDASIGCPLVYPDSGRPYVDWNGIRRLFSFKYNVTEFDN